MMIHKKTLLKLRKLPYTFFDDDNLQKLKEITETE